jgi:hypothetical protein
MVDFLEDAMIRSIANMFLKPHNLWQGRLGPGSQHRAAAIDTGEESIP